MTRVLSLAALLYLPLAGCAPDPQEFTDHAIQRVTDENLAVYVHDPRTNLCFLVSRVDYTFSNVPCTVAVLEHAVNAPR